MTTPYTVSAAVPLVAQHAPVFTAQPDPNQNFDCGESCLKAIAQAVLGLTDAQAMIELDLEVIRSKVIGYSGSGPATPAQLQAVLSDLGIPSTVIQPSTEDAYLWNEWRYLYDKKPLISLRRLETPTASSLHYCTVTQQTESTVSVLDPWTTPAKLLTESYATHWGMAQTPPQWPVTLIGIDRGVSA